MKLFSGTAHLKLAQEVAQLLHVSLGKAEIVRFDDSEVKVTIQEDVKNQLCVVIQPTCNPTDQNLMELLLICDALKRSEAQKIVAVIPLFGYARQNAQHRPGECVSLHVVVTFLEAVGFNEVYTFDLHEEASSGIFSVPFQNLTVFSEAAPVVKKYLGDTIQNESIVIVTPDQEGIERARNFGESFFGDDSFSTATVNKKRDVDKIHQSEALALYGDVTDKTCIIVDDICTSGGTLIHAAELCLKNGAKRVLSVITHHDFGSGVAQIIQNSVLEAFFTSNTIPLKQADTFEKLHEISIAPVIALFLTKINS